MFLRKLGATIYLLWFALYLGAPQYVHHCPEHSAAPAAAAPSHDSAHGDHGASEKSGDETHKCCCPGPQCGTGTLVVPVEAPHAGVSVAIEAQRPPVGVAHAVTSRRAHVLPFATAPPTQVA